MDKLRLVMSDIDGTLLNSQHQLTAEVKATVSNLVDQGIYFILASARSPQGMSEISKELKLRMPLVAYNGALITIPEGGGKYNNIYSLPLEKLDAILVLQTLKQFGEKISCNVYSSEKWYIEKNNKWSKIEGEITNLVPEIISFKELIKKDAPFHKILCIAEPEHLFELEIALEALNIFGISFVRSKANYLEIVNTQVSKFGAMVELSRLLNIPLRDILAIGDNENDLPMIVHSGVGVAMGNAPKSVRAQSDRITLTNDEDGVAFALSTYLTN